MTRRDLAQTIGTAARSARSAAGLTQADVAERVGVSEEFYARIERGGTMPSVPTLVRMLEALQISGDVILGRKAPGEMGRPKITRGAGSPSAKSSQMRALQRRLRRASARTLRLVNLLLKEVEGSRRP
jgi:transcriptional regulator with XRE-family HTH domain